ncbi:uncharacterized protein LOC134260216 [Saccostrea cucullata]|uniref:uncharacterized protein LOC134260216 n=1 Tax=Saccostrea cuccullata TaxID=36930 RepID=UPI002ED21467
MYRLHIILIFITHSTLSNCIRCPHCAGDTCHTTVCDGACLYHLHPNQFPTLVKCETSCHHHHGDSKCCEHENCIAEAFGDLYSKTFVNCPVCHGGKCHKVKCIECKVHLHNCVQEGTCYIQSGKCHVGAHEKCCRDDTCIEHAFSKCHTTTHNSTKAPSTKQTSSSSSVSRTTTPRSISTVSSTLKEIDSTSSNTLHVSSPTSEKPMMSTNGVISTHVSPSTTISSTSSSSQSVRQRTCKVCGDYGNGIPCDIRSIYIGPTAQCEVGNDFCMTDMIHDGSGNEKVFKRCVNETVCRTQWLSQTSDQDHCTQFGKVLVNGAYSCHFCCTSDECNQGLLPGSTTLYTRR